MGAADMKIPDRMMFNHASNFLFRHWWVWDPIPDFFLRDDKMKAELIKENLIFNQKMIATQIASMQEYQVHIDKQIEIISGGM